MRTALALIFLFVATVPAGAAPLWNTTSGPATYVGPGGEYTTEIVDGQAGGVTVCWSYFEPGPYGYWAENFYIRIDESQNVYLVAANCGTDSGGFDEGFGVHFDSMGAHLLVPADPQPGQSWAWPATYVLDGQSATLTVGAHEPVQIGRKTVMAWRIDIDLPDATAAEFFLCTGATLPLTAESFWVAEGLGVVKWTTAYGDTVVMGDAPNVVEDAPTSWGALKSRY